MPTQKNAIARELRAIQIALRQLECSFGRLVPILTAERTRVASSRRKMHITPERRAALKLQGQYMGYMRQLKPAQKAKVRKIRAAKGVRAAIAAAKKHSS
jgi:hypothetical protein